MEIFEEIDLEGCNFFRQNIIFSLLSGRPLVISRIRQQSDSPGIKDFESKFLDLIVGLTNGTEIEVNEAGTRIAFRPGTINGGELDVDCGKQRCISYFLEPLIFIGPFCKQPLSIRLNGVTNAPDELSVDALRATWLSIFSRFALSDEDVLIKINSRGFFPDGGGEVVFKSPVKRNLRPTCSINPGKICKIRGLSYVCKVSPSIASRMIDSAKKMLHGYIADIFISVDQRKGRQGGLSPGYGIILVAETTEGVFYHGEAMSMPKGHQEDQLVPEELGKEAAKRLLTQIYNGGCTDSSAQTLAATFMTLCDKDVSKYMLGPLTIQCCHTLRNLRLFFGHVFKLNEYWKIESEMNGGGKGLSKMGSSDKCLLTCVGIGYYNINKTQL